MDIKEKLKMFKEDLSSISKLLEKNEYVDKTAITKYLSLIKTDLLSENEDIKKTALYMLESLLNQKYPQVQTEIIKYLSEEGGNEVLDSLFTESLKKKVVDCVMTTHNFTDILLPWQNVNSTKLNNILKDAFSNDIPKEKCKHFFINEIIPAMMLNTENTLRNIHTEIAFLLSQIITISELSSEELSNFVDDMKTKYVGVISELRDKDFSNWHKLWIFLVRFCGRIIHNSMDLTNRLLRVVEFAFRNSSIEQRLKGYDCWKALIDNASLDEKHISSSKQIKLLITPLRAKFSKQEVVICKRFDTFVYLLEKLQEKAVLCLQEFLEFCFGSVGDNKDISRSGQGKAIPQLWIKSTKVLMGIIGHSHGDSMNCFNTKDIINLKKPIINPQNMQTYYKIIINSVSESCVLLKDMETQSKRMEAIKCMWVTVFDLVAPASHSDKEEYIPVLTNVLDKFITESNSNPYFRDLVVLVFTVLMSFDKDLIFKCIKSILSQLLTVSFTFNNIPTNISENFKQALMHSFSKVIQKEEKLNMMNTIIECFAKFKTQEENISNMTKIWLFLSSELISDSDVVKIKEFPKLKDFFMWPALNMHRMEDSSKKPITMSWLKIYKKLNQDSETKKLEVLKDLEHIFKNNPLLSSNVVSLLNVMSQFETKLTPDFVNKLMIVASMILVLPNLKAEDEQKISTMVTQCLDPSLQFCKSENDEVISNICASIENILKIYKGFRVLEALSSFLQQAPKDIRLKYSKHLASLLLDLYNKESDSKNFNAKEISKILAVFDEKDDGSEKKTFILPTGRSARIANLAKNSPKSPKKPPKTAGAPTALRLFGKDLDTMSPLKVKGSQLNNTTPSRKKKIANATPTKSAITPSINDESSSEFVQIHTEIKFQPDKLSEHQREVMKKRREDIPALYQDLSQSQDMFGSRSNSKEATASSPKPSETVERESKITNETPVADSFSNGHSPTESNNQLLTGEKVTADTQSIEKSSSDLFSAGSSVASDGSKKSEETSEEKKKRKMEAELLKLKMDIVGAEEFLSTSRRTRLKDKKKAEEHAEKPEKKRQSLGVESNDSKPTPRGRKSMGALVVRLDSSNSDIIPESNSGQYQKEPLESTQSKSNGKVKVETPVSKKKMRKLKQSNEKVVTEDKKTKSSDDKKEVAQEDIEMEEKKVKRNSSPHENLENIQEVSKNEASQETSTPKRGRKRKHSTDDDDEDIIQSSQESAAELTPLLNSSKKKIPKNSFQENTQKDDPQPLVIIEKSKLVEKKDAQTVETTKESINKNDATGVEVTVGDIVQDTETPNTTQDTTLTHETTQELSGMQDSTQDDIPSEVSEMKHPETQDTQTQPETITQTQETTSFSDVSNVLYFDLPKKPLLTDSEQIMCRMDTMSICVQKDSEGEEKLLGKPKAESIEDILGFDSDILPLSTPPNSPSKTSASSLPSSPITIDTPTRTSELLDNTLDISPISSKSNSPVAEIPKTVAIVHREEDDQVEARRGVNNEEEEVTFVDENRAQDVVAVAQNDTPNIQERYSKPSNALSVISPMPTKLFLKRRSAGGMNCSPSTARIKRLMSNFEPKTPTTDAEEIDEDDILRFTRDIPSPLAVPRSGILKRKLSEVSDGDGLSPCAKRKRVNFSDPCLTSKKIFLKDDYMPNLEAKRLFDPIFPSPEDAATSDTNSEGELAETEAGLELVDRPIYPKLVDCKDDVFVILKRVTSPIFINAMTNKLKTKNIRTIGDLAQQTESEINRIPFKVPVVANVYKALDNYYKKKNGITEAEVNGNGVEKKSAPEQADVATEMRSLVEKASTKESKTIDELARILLSSMDKLKIVELVKNLDPPLTCQDILDKNNQDQVLRHILERKCAVQTLKTTHESSNEAQTENLPWEILLRNRPVSDLHRGLTGAIERGLFSKTEVIEDCLLRLVENPAEVAEYLKVLPLRDLENVVMKRLDGENAGEFLGGIMKNLPALASENFMRTFCEKQGFPAAFKVCLESQGDGSRKKDTMVEMFRFISEELDVNTLSSLHMEFINRLIGRNN